ncbi:putative methylase [uncultured Mediterranean phage uvMED]|nr:DNA (cytosine-5-)-methyltransferase (TIGR00675) [uncultured Mediterranean phage uvMED]BAQ85867.1 putative methylase [uncultured Mediterranean phage uvMED]
MNEKIKTLSLFAGIGGIDLGLEATGYFETVQFVEYDPYCQHILKRHWPNVSVWGDVKTFDPDSCGEIDCIVGGYPCQPFSVAGKQKGTQDDRHLWPRMFEIIKHKRPSLILCENVSGHIVLGLDEVLLDLEGEGYSTRAFVIPASAVDANHKRERVWIVAYTKRMGWEQRAEKSREPKREEPSDQSNNSSQGCTESKPSKNVAYTDSRMRRGGRAIRSSGENKQRRIHTTQEKQTSYDIRSETIGCDTVRGEAKKGSIERRLGGVVDGVSSWMDEPNIPRVTTNQTGRVQRLKMLGNAVVPQVVYQLGLAMKELWDEV